MATIEANIKYDIGDIVWLKSDLDTYASFNPPEQNRWWIYLKIPMMLYRVVQILVRKNPDNSLTKLYAIELFLPESKIVADETSAVEMKSVLTSIEEDSLYGFQEGLEIINSKIEDFKDYLNNILDNQ